MKLYKNRKTFLIARSYAKKMNKKSAEDVSADSGEVPSRFELENKGFADLRLTTWLHSTN